VRSTINPYNLVSLSLILDRIGITEEQKNTGERVKYLEIGRGGGG